MELILVVFVFPVFIAFLAAWAVYRVARNSLQKSGNPNVKLISGLWAFVTFAIVAGGIFYLILINLSFRR